MKRRSMRWSTTAAAVVGMFAVGGLSGMAQDASPIAEGSGHAHPAHIHLGTCDELDPNPTFPLSDITSSPSDIDMENESAAAIPVERGVTTVAATVDELQSGGYAINVHQSVEDIGTYIACGNLTGNGSGSEPGEPVVVGLRELNDSDHSGIAVLTGRDDQTEVTVYLAEGLTGAARAAASSGTPTSANDATANATTVDIKDFAYNPATVEIPVGGTVTWTNSDAAPHTATAQDRQALQSGTLDQGDSFSQTFDTPGTIDYFCEFHANMKGTIVVQ
ncbi:MAG: cupredoxin family copper-binding protein [Chloroflexi bacterium]|nr:cupredoxin family copper-binding protein [Chloroflexota bacterium]